MGTLRAGTYAGTALDNTQATWAQRIIAACKTNPGATDRDIVCTLACVAQESRFYMYANDGTSSALTSAQRQAIRASLNVPHDRVGRDSASVGLFQQQPYIPGRSWGWGTIAQCMDVAFSTGSFLSSLLRIANRPNRSVTSLVQAVQRSAYPDAYAKWESLGWALLAAYKASERPPVLGWDLPQGHYYGNVDGPDESHGGVTDDERRFVENIQRWLVYRDCTPIAASRWADTDWADGEFAAETDAAASLWHERFYLGQEFPAQIWQDDYARLTQ